MINRRQALKGIGTSLAIPFLPSLAWATDPKKSETFPTRCAFIYYDMGTISEDYLPTKDRPVSKTLEPLKPNLDSVLILGGLKQDAARGLQDLAGDHARSVSTWLTGVRLKKTESKDISAGISIDQFIANKIGAYTKFPSLEFSMEGAAGGDSGYSATYSGNISWKSPQTPNAKETNPLNAYKRLFTDSNLSKSAQAEAMAAAENNSILDLILDDAKTLKKDLGGNDVRKLDEYLDSVRAIEKRIQSISGKEGDAKPSPIEILTSAPKNWGEHAKLFYDIMALAFQTDTTRVATFMLTNGASGRSYPEIGISEGHHELSHFGNDQHKKDSITKINIYHLEQFNYFLNKLKSIKEGKGTLLDSSMIVYGSCIENGNKHNHDNLPILLAGKGGNSISTGKYIPNCRGNLNELYMAISNRMGVPCESFGDDGKKALPDLL